MAFLFIHEPARMLPPVGFVNAQTGFFVGYSCLQGIQNNMYILVPSGISQSHQQLFAKIRALLLGIV